MDNELVFDNVKFEKAKAIARYNRFQNMMKMLQIFEVVVAVVLISWSWTRVPVAVKLSGEVLVQVSAFLFKPHVVFLIGNGIIVAIVVLCRQTDAGSNDSVTDDILSEEILHNEVQQPIVTATCGGDVPILSCDSSPVTAEPSVATTEDKQVVSSELKVPEIQSNDVATAIDTATKQIQKFKRSQSEKLKREIATASSHRELRRSETDMRRLVVRPGDGKSTVPVEAVDTLSNEEFRHTIEAFIKKNQIFFEKQRLAEAEPEKYERIGIKAF
ncbi:uncharacterized protein [Nicotiana sylvestris]|uniref:Uncharacterized protein LOC104233517 n=1 Tax=Nicotiana sylvestris TaxID=4096 RepID=A0A1U7X6A9_NICSY|nr:PREDICTED: uncharacterized protein LOC104233517 [Nicotiana sylvestris]